MNKAQKHEIQSENICAEEKLFIITSAPKNGNHAMLGMYVF